MMLRSKYTKIPIIFAILYAALIFYLSITSKIGNIRHHVNRTLANSVGDILSALNLSLIRKFLVESLNFVESQSIDVGHVGIYFVFGILLYFAFVCSKNQILEKHSVVIAVSIGTAYGILNEMLQTYLPYRTASIGDAFSNMLGLVLAQILVLTFVFVLSQFQNKIKKVERQVN